MEELVKWVNNPIIWAIIGGILGLATLIVKKTKTKADDKVLEFIKQFLNLLRGKTTVKDLKKGKTDGR